MRNAERSAAVKMALTLVAVAVATMSPPAAGNVADIIFIDGFDTLQVSVVDENGVSAGAGVSVLMQDSSGALLQTLSTDSSGMAVVRGVPGGAMITVAHFSALVNEWRVQTVTAVKSDDVIRMTIGPVAAVNPVFLGSMTVNAPFHAGATAYGYRIGCAQGSNGTPSFTLSIYDNCLRAGMLDLVVIAFDINGTPLVFASLGNIVFQDGGNININVWQTAVTNSSTVSNAPSGSTAVSFGVDGLGAGGSYPYVYAVGAIAPGQGHVFQLAGPAQTALARNARQVSLALSNVGGRARSTELLIRATTSGATDADLSADLLPAINSAQISSVDPTRPMVLMTTAAPAAPDVAVAQASWTSATHVVRWTVWAPGATTAFQYPEMPANYQPSAIDVATLEMMLVGDSDAVSSYAAVRAEPVPHFPFLPDIDGRQRVSYIH